VHLVRHSDAAAFADRVRPMLLGPGRDGEARHHLLLGLSQTLIARPDVYPNFHLWTVEEGRRTLLAALQTPPHNLTVSRPASTDALEFLAVELARTGSSLPGVTAALPEAEDFAARWAEATGARVSRRAALAIHRLVRVRQPPPVAGTMRRAVEADRELLLEWITAFDVEAHEEADASGMADIVGGRLRGGRDAGLVLWEIEAEPVSLAGFTGPTPSGIRVGPVYTPPEHRRRGYASALVAELSAQLLADGRRFCFLYTDLANPTSNHIYRAIGYERVCDSADFAFA
jgi:uncharacterized protein